MNLANFIFLTAENCNTLLTPRALPGFTAVHAAFMSTRVMPKVCLGSKA